MEMMRKLIAADTWHPERQAMIHCLRVVAVKAEVSGLSQRIAD
jgi:hypothetical protein